MGHTLTDHIADFICQDADGLMTPAVRRAAVSAVLDTLAVTIAGGADPAVQNLEASLDPSPAATAYSPWTGQAYSAPDAALLYGMASHMYDYDDVSMLATCHPSAPVLSALMAVQLGHGAGHNASGLDFITAFAVGTEVLVRVGQAMGFRHYELGFHATSTLGAVGAAAAVARLLRLDPPRTRHALAIAASMAGGLRKNFGTMVKPLHVGLAAANGVRAVRMAQAGIEGATEVFESGGYLMAFSGGQTDLFPSNDLAFGRPFALDHPGHEQKRYPCCYMLHKMITATLHLKQQYGCSLDHVQKAHVSMPKGGTKPLIHPYPKSGLNGKFSAPYAIVASLADGHIGLASFTDEAVMRNGLQARLHDVGVTEATLDPPPGTDMGRVPVTLSLLLRDGRTLEHTVLAPPGSPDDPLTMSQLRQKWVDCLVHGLPNFNHTAAGEHFDLGLSLDQSPSVNDWLHRILQPHKTGDKCLAI